MPLNICCHRIIGIEWKDAPAVQLNDDFAGPVIVDFFEFANVTYNTRFVESEMLRQIKRCASQASEHV